MNSRRGNVSFSDTTGGRVVICDEGQWKTVCDYGWGNQEAQVVCRELGESNPGQG